MSDAWLVTGDVHYAMHRRYSTLERGIPSRLRDVRRCWSWMVGRAVEYGCRGVVVCGDLFDDRVSIEIPVLEMAAEGLREAAGAGLEVLIVPGNHDAYLRDTRFLSLAAVGGLARVFREPTVDPALPGMGFVPWVGDAGSLRDGFDAVHDRGARWVFSHVLLDGVAGPEGTGEATAESLGLDRFEAVWLGDVHEPVTLDAAQYTGAPMHFSWADAGRDRGVWVWVPGGEATFVRNTASPQFRRAATRRSARAVREGDFVRAHERAVGHVADGARVVEVEAEESDRPERSEARLPVDAGDTAAVLREYLRFTGRDGDRPLLRLGEEIVAEAGGRA